MVFYISMKFFENCKFANLFHLQLGKIVKTKIFFLVTISFYCGFAKAIDLKNNIATKSESSSEFEATQRTPVIKLDSATRAVHKYQYLQIERNNNRELRGLTQKINDTNLKLMSGGNVSGGGDDIIPLSRVSGSEQDLDALSAYQVSLVGITPSPGKVNSRVAVIDSGISSNSRSIRNVVFFKDFTSKCLTSTVCDESGHGSLVSDIITQVAPEVEIISLKVLQAQSEGEFRHIKEALDWVLENYVKMNIKVVNLSLTKVDRLSGFWSQVDDVKRIVKKLSDANVMIVTAAGNDYLKSMPVFPANSPDVITVGSYSHGFSTDRSQFTPSDFSNFGYASNPSVKHSSFLGISSTQRKFDAWVFKPDILAPGDMLMACSDKCFFVSGTSFATALVSGGLAILKDQQADLSLANLIQGFKNGNCDEPFLKSSFDNSKICSINFQYLLN